MELGTRFFNAPEMIFEAEIQPRGRRVSGLFPLQKSQIFEIV